MQMLLILLAPVFLSATIYMTLGRIIRSLDEDQHSMIRVRRLTKLYVLLDILIFCSQLGGAGVQITGDANIMAIGMKAIMGGLIFQCIALAFYIALAACVHLRLNREPTGLSHTLEWRKYMWAIYLSGAAILVRSLVRVVEYGEGAYGAVSTHEAFLYVFDAFLIWFLMVCVLVVHPGQLIKTAMRRIAGIYAGGERDSAAVGLTSEAHEMKMTSSV